jgi:disulfide oxidoreductase YuzD
MKRILIAGAAFVFALNINAQDAPSAQPGTTYGTVTEKGSVVSANELETKMVDNKYEGKVKGKVVEVCKAMGCWAKLQKDDGSTIMIKVKDHEFAMPLDIVGKIVVAEGSAQVKETSVNMLKHYAEDAGKSKEEIEKIKESKKEVLMTVKGVKVIE